MSSLPITELLHAAASGDEPAFRRLYSMSYQELRRLAHVVRGGQDANTINTTGLVHEAYLKLVSGDALVARDRAHFFRIAARAMRQVLVDLARRRSTRRRGLAVLQASHDEDSGAAGLSASVIALDAALRELEDSHPRQARVVECRFFAGLSVAETAVALDVSTPTVKRDWRMARAFLSQTLGADA
jgi:RNA polymerase sigma factor (TIGR02999 family)